MRQARRHKSNHAKAERWYCLSQCIPGKGTGRASGTRASGNKLNRAEIANCQLQIANCKLQTDSSFILHPSSFRLHPSSPGPWPLAPRPSHGVTLVEMLIVITIIMIMAVIALRVIQPLGDRRIREAARAVSGYLSSARNRAMELGRPCGVIFRRANGTNFPTGSMVMDQCVVPPPYAGETINAAVRLQDWTYRPDAWPYWNNKTSDPSPVLKTYVLKVQVRVGDFPNKLLIYSDRMQLGGQGPFYWIVRDPDNSIDPDYYRTTTTYPSMNPSSDPIIYDFPEEGGYIKFDDGSVNIRDTDGDGWIDTHRLTLVLYEQSDPMQAMPWPKFADSLNPTQMSMPVSFQILRSYRKTPATSMQLPAGTVVDLDFSGPGDGLFPTVSLPYTPPIPQNLDVGIVFSSNGAIERIIYYNTYYNPPQYKAWRTAWPVYLLVGSSTRVRDFVNDKLPTSPNQKELPNWADLSSVWLTINYQTGMVSTSENSTYTGTPDWTTANSWGPFVIQSRNIAREQQSMGGR